MYVPTDIRRSTYSYAIGPFFDGGVFSMPGMIALMFQMGIYNAQIDHKGLSTFLGMAVLGVIHLIIKDQETGSFTHLSSLYLGDLCSIKIGPLKRLFMPLAISYASMTASTCGTLPPPTLINHYES